MLRTCAVVAALLLPLPALAQEVEIRIDEALARKAGLDAAEVRADLDDELRSTLHLDALSTYLDSLANAALLATKGMGVDYATEIEAFVIGGSVGTGIDDGGFRFGRGDETLPAFGYAFQVAVMAGLNLGVLSHGEGVLSRVVVYGHGMALDTSVDVFDGSLHSVGGHVQIALVKPRGDAAASWGGLALTTGFERSHYELGLTRALPVPVPGTGGLASWDGLGEFTLGTTTDSVPVELSTHVRLLVLTVFGGAGVDMVDGGADASIRLSGDVTADVGGRETRIGTASVRYAAHGEPVTVFPRVFAGAQVHLLPVKVYAQLNAGLERGVGGHMGVRLAW